MFPTNCQHTIASVERNDRHQNCTDMSGYAKLSFGDGFSSFEERERGGRGLQYSPRLGVSFIGGHAETTLYKDGAEKGLATSNCSIVQINAIRFITYFTDVNIESLLRSRVYNRQKNV